MSFELLILLDLILLSRLAWLWVGDSSPAWRALLPGALLALSLLCLFEFGWAVVWLLLATLLVTLAGFWLEGRQVHSDFLRLIGGLALMIAASLADLFDGSLAFRPISVSAVATIDALFPLVDLSLSISDRSQWLILFGFLVLGNESNLLVRSIFQYCQLTPGSAQAPAIGASAFRAGRVIGFLERWLMYLVILGSDDLSALAFIIAAKGLARMKQLEEREFAEYMLIGTLMSALAALLMGLWVERGLSP